MKRFFILLSLQTIVFMAYISAQVFTDIHAPLVPNRQGTAKWIDYDNDGDLDVFLSGQESAMSKLYRNDGDDTFTDINAALLNVSYADVSWSDYDNDGYLDVLLTGVYPGSKLMRNNQNGTFSEVTSAVFQGVNNSSVAWGDYDNDGKPDLLLLGSGPGGVYYTKVYHNDGNGVFTDINAPLTPLIHGTGTWADYDNDGDLDILICGYDGFRHDKTFLYRNNGAGAFTNVAVGIEGSTGDLAWGDCDNDGDLDILWSDLPTSRVYRNNGNAQFNNIFTTLDTASVGFSGEWGDYDNDGNLDMLVAGFGIFPRPDSGKYRTKIFRGNGDSVFTDIEAGLLGADVTARFGDYDHDGDLDILQTGVFYNLDAYLLYSSKIYRNDSGSVTNTPPFPPADLLDSVINNSVKLSWSRATDAQTPSKGLTYNIFIGTTENGVDIVSPMASVETGVRRIPAIGNVCQDTAWMIKNLRGGKYYWGVQAIDHAYAGSAFAKGGSFVVKPYEPGLVFPLNQARGVPREVNFTWKSSAGALSYHIQVAADSLFMNVVAEDTLLSDTSMTVNMPESMTTYYWRVKASNEGGSSNFSGFWRFETILAIPMTLFPADGSVDQELYISFGWQAVFGAEHYYFQVAFDSNFNHKIFDNILDTAGYSANISQNITVYWRVRAENAYGISDWSQRWKFKTKPQVPDKPLLLSPADGETITSLPVTLSWQQGTHDAYFYWLEWSRDSTFATTSSDPWLIDLTRNVNLPQNGVYWWRVRAYNTAGHGAFSDPWTFTAILAGAEDAENISSFELQSNYPNPFNPSTVIKYQIPRQEFVSLIIFDVFGRTVETLVNGQMPAGKYEATWAPNDLASGVYFYRITAGNFTDIKKMLLLR